MRPKTEVRRGVDRGGILAPVGFAREGADAEAVQAALDVPIDMMDGGIGSRAADATAIGRESEGSSKHGSDE